MGEFISKTTTHKTGKYSSSVDAFDQLPMGGLSKGSPPNPWTPRSSEAGASPLQGIPDPGVVRIKGDRARHHRTKAHITALTRSAHRWPGDVVGRLK